MLKLDFRLLGLEEIYGPGATVDSVKNLPFQFYVDADIAITKGEEVLYEEHGFSFGAFVKDLDDWVRSSGQLTGKFEWDGEFDGWLGKIKFEKSGENWLIGIDGEDGPELHESISDKEFLTLISSVVENGKKEIKGRWGIDIQSEPGLK